MLCAVALSGALVACGGEEAEVPSGTTTLTIYSSTPLQGADRPRSRDMVNAIKLALQQAGGRAGPFDVTYVSLDAATREASSWTRDAVLANARKAVRDANAIAYIGERDSAATALSLPITNAGHLLQVSASSTYDGLTRATGRAGEPERYYPSGDRTFARVVPRDHVQASALVGYMKTAGVRSLALLADSAVHGGGLAAEVRRAAVRQGIDVVDRGRIDADASDPAGVARTVAGADAFLFAGTTERGAARVFNAVAAAAPATTLYGPAAVADRALVRDLSKAARSRLRVTTTALPVRVLPASASAFRDAFRTTFGRYPDPEALYAYEACRAVLDAIERAGVRGNQREVVIDRFLDIQSRASVLGTYSIDRYGDTSLSTFAGNRVEGTELVLDKVLKVRN